MTSPEPRPSTAKSWACRTFLVDDIQAAYEELQARGVTLDGPPHRIFTDEATGTEEWLAFFEDSEGNMLAITSRVPPAA